MKKILFSIIIVVFCSFKNFCQSQIPPKQLQRIDSCLVNDEFIHAYSGGNPGLNWPRIHFTDLNKDGIPELYIGDQSGRISKLVATGFPSNTKFELSTDFFGGIQVPFFNAAPWFFDIDNDGTEELFVSNGYNGGNGGFVQLYDFSSDSNEWTLIQDSIANLDVYDHATVTVGDIDNDGDGDIIVGGGWGWVSFIPNIGDAYNPIWGEVVDNYNQSIFYVVGFKATPTLVDLNCDGWLDIVFGSDKGLIKYFRNNGIVNGEIEWELINENLAGIDFTHIDYTHAAFADLNNDGFVDMLVSESFGNVNLFLHKGGCTPEFEWVTGSYLTNTIDVGSNAHPIMADLNGDCILDMVIGKPNGQMRLYLNTGTDEHPNWQFQTEYFLEFDSWNTYEGYNEFAPTFCDVDKDGDKDLIIGHRFSGITKHILLENKSTFDNIDFELVTNNFLEVEGYYPNNSFLFGDFNADGNIDYAIKAKSIQGDSIFITYHNGTNNPWFNAEVLKIPTQKFENAFAADYDSDGYSDIILNNTSSASPGIWLLENDDTIQSWDTILLSETPITGLLNGVLEDLDNNFSLDIIGGTADGGIVYYKDNTSWANFSFTNSESDFIFQDESFISAGSWFWDFGDGNSTLDQNPSHSFSTEGEFEVCLTISKGCKSQTICQTINVCSQPIASFETVIDELTITVSDLSMGAETHQWSISDGSIYSSPGFTHSFEGPGVYTICQSTINNCGEDIYCEEISIYLNSITETEHTNEISIYPNPASDFLFINGINGHCTIKLFNTIGQLVYKTNQNLNSNLDISFLPTGAYMIQLKNGLDSFSSKIIKE